MTGGGLHSVDTCHASNTFGCVDLHGNVMEWCRDFYDGEYYSDSPEEDPAGPAIGTALLLRRRSFLNHAADSRSAHPEGRLNLNLLIRYGVDTVNSPDAVASPDE